MTYGFYQAWGHAIVGGGGGGGYSIGHGWNTLPLGAGGLVIGMHIANDGSMVCRTDVGNIYRWSGTVNDYADPTKKWVPLITYASLSAACGGLALPAGVDFGGWEHVLAPGSSNVHLAVFGKMDNTYKSSLWYSLNSGTTWSRTGIDFAGLSAQSNASNPAVNTKTANFKIAIDPINASVAYCGMPTLSGNSAGAYRSLNLAGTSSLASWSSVKTSGSTPVPPVNYGISCGIVIDPSFGTTVLSNGETVTKHVYLPIGGAGIYESKDGGVTFTDISTSTFGTSNFFVTNAGCNYDGVYYAVVVQDPVSNLYTNAPWTTSSPTITFQSPNPGVIPGMAVIDNSTGAYLGKVSSFVGTTLTLTANAAAAGGAFTPLKFIILADGRAATSWTTSSTTISMLSTSSGLAPGMTVYNKNTSQVIGTVSSYSGTTLTLTAPAAHASSTGNDFLTFTQTGMPDVRGVWRYVPSTSSAGTWTNITAGGFPTDSYTQGTALIVDPRNTTAAKSYLSVFGPNGITNGYTATNANTAAAGAVNWAGRSGGNNPALKAASYDIGYINQIFGQGLSGFTYGTSAIVDANGTCWWGGNQSLFYFGSSGSVPTPAGVPDYGGSINQYCWSMGRGQESTVTVDALCSPGGTYPIMALHDIGAPAMGTFTTYPTSVAVPFKEYACTNLEYAASDPSFIVARTTSQGSEIDASCYSTDYGATWTQLNAYPNPLWAGQAPIGGQIVAVDHDHWVVVPNGFNIAAVPAYTTNATGASPTWALCSGLPAVTWFAEPWFFGTYTPKPLAVGYGTDLGTVWACAITTTTTATLYRSTNSGQSFSTALSWTVSSGGTGAYCLSVPGFPNELWITSRFTSGGTGVAIWHITNANTATPDAPVAVNLPVGQDVPYALTLGAPATPGGYPTLYLVANTGFGTTDYLYEGQYSGSGNHVNWTLFGTSGQANGINPDLPPVCQIAGIQSIRADWNTYRRLYVMSRDCGFAYYNP